MNLSYRRDEDLEEALLPSWKGHLAQQHEDLSNLIYQNDGSSQMSRAWAIVKSAALRDSRRTGCPEIEAAVQEIEQGYGRIDAMSRRMALPKFYNYLHNPLSPRTASEFFDIVEIAEMVLCYLPLPDILNMQRVSKRLFSIIENCSHIQEKFNLQSQFEISSTDVDDFFGRPPPNVIFSMRLKDEARLALRRLAVPHIFANFSDQETYHGPPDYGVGIHCHSGL